MKPNRLLAQEAAEDIFFGQIVLVWARWFFIAAGAVLALWSASTALELTLSLLLVIGLMGLNFFVHARYLMEKPANRLLLLGASVLDVALITGLVLFWPKAHGLGNQFFIFYYPLLFAFALVFPPRLAVPYTIVVVLLYAVIGVTVDPTAALSLSDFQTLSMRLISLAAMGGLGTYYYRAQRAKRRAAAQA